MMSLNLSLWESVVPVIISSLMILLIRSHSVNGARYDARGSNNLR
jgi:hypothetical protein